MFPSHWGSFYFFFFFFSPVARELSPFAIFSPHVNYATRSVERNSRLFFSLHQLFLLYLHIDTKAIELAVLPFLWLDSFGIDKICPLEIICFISIRKYIRWKRIAIINCALFFTEAAVEIKIRSPFFHFSLSSRFSRNDNSRTIYKFVK